MQEVMQKIKKLENQKISAEKEKAELAKFKLVSSHFYKTEEYSEEDLNIEFTMKNETNYSISKGYFIGILASPNRSVPWLYKSFNYSIPGGLEPGEEIKLRISPQYREQIDAINIAQNAVFIVEAKQLNGVNNKPVLSVCKFTQEDETRLKELKESLRHKSISESEIYDDDTTYDTDDCPEINDNYDYELSVDLLP